MRALVLLIISTMLFAGGTIKRCQSYIQEVRRAHYSQFGVDYPYWNGVGQLQQESGCRNIVSLDGVGSQGLPQITWRWHKDTLQKHSIKSINAIPDQLKAQAILMKGFLVPKYGLWVTYQRYNGGDYVLKELNRAGSENWELAKGQCRRGQSCFTYKGIKSCRSNCDINYEYSVLVYKYGEQYDLFKGTSKYRYW